MESRALVARFLHFYPQFKLRDLEEMDPGEFLYLVGGMLDVVAPEMTEPRAEKLARQIREANEKAVQKAISQRRVG